MAPSGHREGGDTPAHQCMRTLTDMPGATQRCELVQVQWSIPDHKPELCVDSSTIVAVLSWLPAGHWWECRCRGLGRRRPAIEAGIAALAAPVPDQHHCLYFLVLRRAGPRSVAMSV